MNLEDLATSVDASEIHDTTDMGRLTSPLFSQEREVSGIKFTVSCSQTHSSVERPMRDVDPFSAWRNPRGTLSRFQASGNRCRKEKISRIGESAIFSNGNGKEFCPNREILMTSLNRKLIKLFKENLWFRQDYLKRSLNWTEEDGECEMRILLFNDTGMQFQSQRMEPYQANQL